MIIGNVTIITFGQNPEVIQGGGVYVENGVIADVGSLNEIQKRYPEAEYLDGDGRFLLPGWINCHTHLYSAMARGISLNAPSPGNFNEILKSLWWRLDRVLDEEAVRLSAFMGIIEAIRSGTTLLIDHHSSPGCIDGSLDMIAEAFEEAGIRGVICYETSDRDGPEARDAAIRENIRFIEKSRKENPPLLRGMFGLHASFTLSDETLKRCVEAGKSLRSGFHVHCAEAESDLLFTREHYGKTVVQRFADAGLTGEHSILSHCVHITENDVDLLRETGSIAVHNPRSNMNNAVGCAPLLSLVEKGILVGIGTDGMSSSATDDLQTVMLLQRHSNQDPAVAFEESCRLLVENNPRIASRFFNENPGVIEEGSPADVILVNYNPPTPVTSDNLYGHLLFGMARAHVDTVITAGKIIMKNNRILTIDEEEISRKSQEKAVEIWNRF